MPAPRGEAGPRLRPGQSGDACLLPEGKRAHASDPGEAETRSCFGGEAGPHLRPRRSGDTSPLLEERQAHASELGEVEMHPWLFEELEESVGLYVLSF